MNALFIGTLLSFFLSFINCNPADNSNKTNESNLNQFVPISELGATLNYTGVAAHRCFYKNKPENSIAAITEGISVGVEFLETDTRTSSDGVVVLFHDETLNRVTNGSGNVADKTFNALSNLLLKNKNGVLSKQPISSLQDALLKIKGKNVYLHLEVKDFNFKAVVAVIQKTQTENQVIVFANDENAYTTLSQFNGISINPVCRNNTEFNFYLFKTNTPMLNLAGAAFNVNNTAVAKKNKKLTWRGITSLSSDLELLSSDANKPNLDAVLDINPSIIHTDYADDMIAYLKTKNKRQ